LTQYGSLVLPIKRQLAGPSYKAVVHSIWPSGHIWLPTSHHWAVLCPTG